MGGIGGMLGLAGGAAGSGFNGQQGSSNGVAPIVNPVQAGQLSDAYTGAQNSLASQQALMQALQAQNGIQNQSQVYNQMQGIANGTGPNPAQAMLNNTTGQNIQNQAAMMAGQRGAGANVGLMSRQAGQVGAGIQQNAAGQGAALQAQQSLNAMNAAGNIAGNQVANQMGATTANSQAQQNEQQQLLQAQAAANNANVAMQSNINSGNAGLTGKSMDQQSQMVGGLMNGIGMLAAAKGGEVQKFADGGTPYNLGTYNLGNTAPAPSPFGIGVAGVSPAAAPGPGLGVDASMPQSDFAKSMKNWSAYANPGDVAKPQTQSAQSSQNSQPLAQGMASMVSGLGAAMAAKGGQIHDYRGGGSVMAKNSNEKAVAKGNSYANDKIPALLSEGEVVIDRDTMQSKDPVNAAARFVQAVLAKKRGK